MWVNLHHAKLLILCSTREVAGVRISALPPVGMGWREASFDDNSRKIARRHNYVLEGCPTNPLVCLASERVL